MIEVWRASILLIILIKPSRGAEEEEKDTKRTRAIKARAMPKNHQSNAKSVLVIKNLHRDPST